MSYKKALEALEQYAPRYLTLGHFRSPYSGQCCAIGALAPGARRAGCATVYALYLSESEDARSAVREIRALGMTEPEAAALMYENDGFDGLGHERYEHVLGWLRDRVAEET